MGDKSVVDIENIEHDISKEAKKVVLKSPSSAFGEVLVSQPTPIVQLQYPYNINTELVEERSNGGSASIDSNRLKVSTGAVANQSSQIFSKVPIKYNPGQGGLIRFTSLFTTGVANSTQYIGIGDSGDGYFFGYSGVNFGVLRRQGGKPEIRTLTITTKSTTAENITITLDGDVDTGVTVTDATAGTVATTANEIAEHDFSNVGRGWKTYVRGADVIFISYDSLSKTGTYSLSGTTAVGTFAQTLSGVVATETFIVQTDWNVDKMDGTGISRITLDPTKGNVFQIVYQWLGFGQVCFFIEDSNGEWVLVHRIKYSNLNTVPSVDNPTLPLCAIVENTSNTSDVVMYSSSMAGFVEGKNEELGTIHSEDRALSVTTEASILTLGNRILFASKENRVRMKVVSVNIATDGAKSVNFACYQNTTLGGTPSFSDHDTNVSVAEIDTAGTTISGGNKVIDIPMEKVGSNPLNVDDLDLYINPGETFTVSAKSANSNDVEVGITWKELF